MRPNMVAITMLAMAAIGSASTHEAVLQGPRPVEQKHTPTLEDKLKATVAEFDSAHQPMTDAVLALAYEHRLPLALECVTSDAVQKPLDVRLRGQNVRNLIAVMTASVPGCRVDFSHGLVDVYSANARTVPSDPFNTVLPEYHVTGLPTDLAEMMLFCTLGRQLYPRSAGCGGSTAGDQWGHVKISLVMRNAKVYEILNAIVAQNGEAVWTPIRTSKTTAGPSRDYLTSFWSIYPLDADFERSVAAGVRALFPTSAGDPRHGDAGWHGLPLDANDTRPGGGPQPCGHCSTITAPLPKSK